MADSTGPYLIQAMELSKDWWTANEYCKHTPFFGWLKYLLRKPDYMDIWVDNKKMPKCVFLVKKGDGESDYVIIKEMRDAEDKIQLVKPFLQNSNIIRMNKHIDFDYIESDLWDLTVVPALTTCHPSFMWGWGAMELGACLSPDGDFLQKCVPGYESRTDKFSPESDLRNSVEKMMHVKDPDDPTPGYRHVVGHTVYGRVVPVLPTDWRSVQMRLALALMGRSLLVEDREMFVITNENDLQPFHDLGLGESRRLQRIAYRCQSRNGT